MELRTLRYFVAVATHGSVTAAANAVHVAQPSLSRQLQGLERELGVDLFDRSGGRLRLTSAGTALLAHAQDLLIRAQNLRGVTERAAAGRLTSLRIAAPSTTISDVVAPFIATFDATDPMPSVITVDPPRVFEAIDSGVADLVLAPSYPPHRLKSRVIADFPLLVYLRPDDKLAGRDAVAVPELDPQRLLVLPRAFVQRQVLEAAAQTAGVSLDGAREVTSPEVAQALAAAGWGRAVVSDDPRYGLCGLPLHDENGPVTMRVHAAWSATHFASGELETIATRIQDFCQISRPNPQHAESDRRGFRHDSRAGTNRVAPPPAAP